MAALTEQRICELLAAHAAGSNSNPIRENFSTQPPQPAAVLVPLLQQGGAWHLLYILRAQVAGDLHSAQVAFPGGRFEAYETQAEPAALRETYEEIGVDPGSVRLLGRLEDFVTISNYQVTPCIGVIPWPTELKPEPREVQRVFTIPLSWLADPANREERERMAPQGQTLKVIYFQQFGKELLWGVTARITLNFLQAMELA